VIVYQADPFGWAVRDGVQQHAVNLGLTVVGVYEWPIRGGTTTRLNAVTRAAMRHNANVLVGALGYEGCVGLVKMAKLNGFSPKAFVLPDCVADERFERELGQDARWVIGAVGWDLGLREFPFDEVGDEAHHYFPRGRAEQRKRPSAEQFAQVFTGRYRRVPSYDEAAAFAQGVVIQAAISRLASPLLLDFERFQMLVLRCFYGAVEFDAFGRNIRHAYAVVQISTYADRDGRFRPRLVWPFSSRTTVPTESTLQYVFPP